MLDQFGSRLHSGGGANTELRLIRWRWRDLIGDVDVISSQILRKN
jgi:hypothetical protein